MNSVFPYAAGIAGVLVLIVGFGFHWIGQLISLTNRDLAKKIGIWEKDGIPEYEVYDNAMAVADVAIGWVYGIAGAGLILGTSWGYELAWVPGTVMVYHSLGFWFWTANQKKAGHHLEFTKMPARICWFMANFVTGALAIAVAWNAF
jgi:hypothetical protein